MILLKSLWFSWDVRGKVLGSILLLLAAGPLSYLSFDNKESRTLRGRSSLGLVAAEPVSSEQDSVDVQRLEELDASHPLNKTASNKLLQSYYSFGADRYACDGQCMYCSNSHAHSRWARVREILTTYKERHDRAVLAHDYTIAQAWHFEIQELLDWSWDRHKFECIPGIINLRLASYGFTPLTQFSDADDDVMDWLIQFNAHTGVLDLLQSAWPQLLQGGWPIFMLMDEVSRKMRAFLKDRGSEYPKLWHTSLCDAQDAGQQFVEEYWSLSRNLLDRGANLELGHHMGLVLKRPHCEVGLSTALLGVASELIERHEIYMSSMEELHNVIFVLITAAQDSVISYSRKRNDISLWFDLLLTKWPLWKMLDRLSCKSSSLPCVVRSGVRCYSPTQRSYVDCHTIYKRPSWKPSYALCGEHDTCTLLNSTNNLNFTYYETIPCIDWKQPKTVLLEADREHGPEMSAAITKPFLRHLTHDDEQRICSQCGQDGVLRTIFRNIRFANTPVVVFERREQHDATNRTGLVDVFLPGSVPHTWNEGEEQSNDISEASSSELQIEQQAAVDRQGLQASRVDVNMGRKMLSSLEAPQAGRLFSRELESGSVPPLGTEVKRAPAEEAKLQEQQLLREVAKQAVVEQAVAAEKEFDYTPPFFVEFGARKPHMLNSAWLREHCGWRGLIMDFQPGGTKHGGCGKGCVGKDLVQNEFITAENVNEVFQKYGVPREPDLLTIDIDFNDYWVWKSVLERKEYFPRVVAVDYNADLSLEETKAVRYDANYEWDGTRYTTASLHAYYLLAQQHGYEYAYNLEMGSHAFFIRRDLLHPDDWSLPIRAVTKLSHKADYSGRPFLDTLFATLGKSPSAK
ncbi:unnamed protein product [Amoebophrya sp. A25]|nr:unnamed protein product [Amoebophrya sp. A25]|eukprot:GSA25T00001198001.1